MHRSVVWPDVTGPVTVEYDGETTVHETLVAAAGRYGSLSLSKDGSRVMKGASFLSEGAKIRFIDFFGHAFDPEEVLLAADEADRLWKKRWLLRRMAGRTAPFREAPVPRTGKRGGGRYYRRMKTTQERREALGLLADAEAAEYGVKARPARNGSNLPHAWDDFPIQRDDRSWKRFRKNQWK